MNLVDDVLELHSKPALDPGAPYGPTYLERTVHGPEDAVASVAISGATVVVAELVLPAR